MHKFQCKNIFQMPKKKQLAKLCSLRTRYWKTVKRMPAIVNTPRYPIFSSKKIKIMKSFFCQIFRQFCNKIKLSKSRQMLKVCYFYISTCATVLCNFLCWGCASSDCNYISFRQAYYSSRSCVSKLSTRQLADPKNLWLWTKQGK